MTKKEKAILDEYLIRYETDKAAHQSVKADKKKGYPRDSSECTLKSTLGGRVRLLIKIEYTKPSLPVTANGKLELRPQ